MTDNIVMVASYPKTGSTWLRFVLSEMFVPGSEISETIPSFLKGYPDRSPEFELFGRTARFIKTHFYPKHPRFSSFRGQIIAAITIRRHPLDVLLSSLNYAYTREHSESFINGLPKPVDQIVSDGEMQHYIDQFIAKDGFPWHHTQSGPFSRHMPLWRRASENLPYLELRYEDMAADAQQVIESIYKFLGRPYAAADVTRVFEAVDKETQVDGKFFWSRKAHNFETRLPQAMADDFNRRYKHVLREHGY
jgi:hypothetical protein